MQLPVSHKRSSSLSLSLSLCRVFLILALVMPTALAAPGLAEAAPATINDGERISAFIEDAETNQAATMASWLPASAVAGPARVQTSATITPTLTVALTADVQPTRVRPGELLTYTVNVVHSGFSPLESIVISDTIPAGATYVADSASGGFRYRSQENRLVWQVPALRVGQVLTGTFQVRARGLALGETITNTVSAVSAVAEGRALAGIVAEIVPGRQDQQWIPCDQVGWLRSSNGRVEVNVPQGALNRRWQISYGEAPPALILPPHIRFAFTLEGRDESGQSLHRFDRPLTLVYPFSRRELTAAQARRLSFYTFDETSGRWQRLPTGFDAQRGLLQAETDHFSVFGLGDDDTDPPESNADADPGPNIRGAEPQLFSGSVGFSYPFDLPPGQGGLTPALGLTYSSSRHRRSTGHFSLVGHGWDILGENYIRKSDPMNLDTSEIIMVLNGRTYTVSSLAGEWKAKEDPFLSFWWVDPTEGSPYYQLTVRTRDGTLHVFRGRVDVNSANPKPTSGEPPAVYRWENADECNGSTGAPFPDWVRLPLVEVEDAVGNKIEYEWDSLASNEPGIHGSNDLSKDEHGCDYIRSLRLTEIAYNFDDNGLNPQTVVRPRYDMRYDRSDRYHESGVRLFTIYKLNGVDVLTVGVGGADRIIRQYDLVHWLQCDPSQCDAKDAQLLVKQIRENAGVLAQATSFVYNGYDPENGNNFASLPHPCRHGYLTQLTNPYGGQEAFGMQDNGDTCERPPNITQRTMTDPVTGGSWTWEYAFSDWDTEAYGYGQANVLSPDSGSEKQLVEHSFCTTGSSECPATSTEQEKLVDTDHLAGREYQTVTCVGSSPTVPCAAADMLARSETDWVSDSNNLPDAVDKELYLLPLEVQPTFVYPAIVRTYLYDPDAPSNDKMVPQRKLSFVYGLDRQGSHGANSACGFTSAFTNTVQYGNLTQRFESTYTWHAPSNSWIDAVYQENRYWYYPDTSHWILNKLAREQLHNGSALQTQSVYWYDDSYDPACEQTSQWTPPSQGLVTTQRDLEDPTVYTHLSYWPNGNMRSATDPNGNTTESFYDGRYKTYPICTKNALGHTVKQRYYGVPGSTDAGCTTVGGSDAWNANGDPIAGRFFGQLEQRIDANSAATAYEYNGLGRLWKVMRPGDNSNTPTVRLTYTEYNAGAQSPFWIKREQRDNESSAGTATYLETATFYDGLGHSIQTQSEAEPDQSGGRIVVASSAYNGLGAVVRQNAPYFDSIANGTLGQFRTPDWNQPNREFMYDAFGRATHAIDYDGSSVRTFYRGRRTAVIDELNRQVIQENDVFGRLFSSQQFLGLSGGSPNWTANPNAEALYQYDVADRLMVVTAPGGHDTTITYDSLGRKISMDDPDMGVWGYGYDSGGNLTRQRDARGETICFYYDQLNRLRGKTYEGVQASGYACPADPGGGNYDVENVYDATAGGNYGIGRRTAMTDASGSTLWTYDARGRLATEIKALNGWPINGDIDTVWFYDAMDRVVQSVPYQSDGFWYEYSKRGKLSQVTRLGDEQVTMFYNALGQVTERRMGYSAGPNPEVRQIFTYSAGENFKLTGLKSGLAPNYNGLQNIDYTYDDTGNVLQISDLAALGGAQTQSFTYDALNRLDTAETDGSPGGYPLQDYDYSEDGNIVKFANTTLAYEDANHPHGVTKVGGVQRYWYDANGNVRQRANPDQLTLTYDAENRLSGISGAVSATYVYDGDGNLAKATVNGLTTFFPSPQYELVETTSGVFAEKYYMMIGSARISVQDRGENPYGVYWLLADHLGSTSVTVDASDGARVTELRYYPNGAARHNPGGQETTYRYTGQRFDVGTGLYFFQSRWYDPLVGRFISPDTIVPSPGDPQSLNRYTYVSNNPLKFVDPSGHDACAADDRACWEDEWYWKDRWYKEHGYENTGERYVYTGNYVIDNAVALLRDDDLRRRKILGFARDLADNGTTAGEALARVTAYAAAFYKSVGAAINPYSTPQYVNDVSHVLNGMAGVDIVLDLLRETKKTDPYFVGEDKFPDTDLKAIFQDGTGNQPYHFWFYVAASFWNGPDAAQAGNLFHELVPPQQGRSFSRSCAGSHGC